MIKLGITQKLIVAKKTDFGLYLNETGNTLEEKILLPKNQIPEETQVGDFLNVFVYKDSEDRLIATLIEPYVQLGGFALLQVIDTTPIGAFLDWGLPKDLLLPFKEQTRELKKGDYAFVGLYIDKSSRLCATMNVYPLLKNDSPYQKDDLVKGIVYELSEKYGAYVAVDNQYSALIPKKELFQPLKVNDLIEARVALIKEDNRLDLSLRQKSYIQLNEDAELIYEKLTENNGFLPFHDKSDPDEIKNFFHLSKNAFKRALGRLLKSKKIEMKDDGIYIL